jgi:hypothetical protein
MCLSNSQLLLPLSQGISTFEPCSDPISIPTGATHLLVRSHNQFGSLASTGRWTKLIDWTGAVPEIPAALPIVVDFLDRDLLTENIGGVVNINVASPETADIESYRIYWHGKNGIVEPVLLGGRSFWVAEASATGYNVQAVIEKGTTIPHMARRLYVVPVNRDGPALEGTSKAIFDHGYETKKSFDSTVETVGIALGVALGLVIFLLIIIKLRFVIVRCKSRKPKPKPKKLKKAATADTLEDGTTLAIEAGTTPEQDADTSHQNAPAEGSLRHSASKLLPRFQHRATADVSSAPPEISSFISQSAFNDKGARVEYWSNAHKLFLPAIVMSEEEVIAILDPREGRKDVSMHQKAGEPKRAPIWLRMMFDRKVLEDADPERLRHTFQPGEPVQVLLQGEWLAGRVNSQPSLVQYNIGLADGATLLTKVPAHEVRSHFSVGDPVDVWTEAEWKQATVFEVSANLAATKLPRNLFESQQVVGSLIQDGSSQPPQRTSFATITTTSKDVRWSSDVRPSANSPGDMEDNPDIEDVGETTV